MCQTDLRRFSAKFKLVVNGLFMIIFKKEQSATPKSEGRERRKKER